MKQIDIEFVQKLSEDMMQIQEITNLNVICNCMNYCYIKDRHFDKYGKKDKLTVYGEVFFEIEYIPIDLNEFKHLEITKVISDFIRLNKPVPEEENPIKEIIIESKGVRLLDKDTISINAAINIMIDND